MIIRSNELTSQRAMLLTVESPRKSRCPTPSLPKGLQSPPVAPYYEKNRQEEIRNEFEKDYHYMEYIYLYTSIDWVVDNK